VSTWKGCTKWSVSTFHQLVKMHRCRLFIKLRTMIGVHVSETRQVSSLSRFLDHIHGEFVWFSKSHQQTQKVETGIMNISCYDALLRSQRMSWGAKHGNIAIFFW
jgi:hypothetical protein